MNGQALSAFSLRPTARTSTSESSPGDGQFICLQNIGPAEQRKRFRSGVIALIAGLAIGALFILTGLNHWWRLILFLPFAGGAIGIFQSREKT